MPVAFYFSVHHGGAAGGANKRAVHREGQGTSCSIVEQIGIYAVGRIPHDAVLGFENLLHTAPDIVTAPHATDR